MNTIDARRLDDARVAGELMSTSAGRKMLADFGHRPGGWLVAAHFDESLSTVMARVESAPISPVTVIGYAGSRRVVLTVEPSNHERTGVKADVDPGSTLGMLIDAMKASGSQTWSIHLTPFRAATFCGHEEPVSTDA